MEVVRPCKRSHHWLFTNKDIYCEVGSCMKNRVIPVILLILCLTLALASPAMAAQKPVKKIGTAANYDSITVTAPSSINLGVMTVGRATTGQSNSDGSITNAAAPWTVHVSDTATGNPGHMVATGPVYLTQQLKIGQTPDDLYDADSGFNYSGSGNTGDLPFYVSQQVEPGDAPGSYSITITFVISYQ